MEESARKTELADRLIDVWQTAVFWSLLAQYLQRPQPERNSVAENQNLPTKRVELEPTCPKCASFREVRNVEGGAQTLRQVQSGNWIEQTGCFQSLRVAERVGFIPVVPPPINDLGSRDRPDSAIRD
jgi:hypothetical protein